MLGLAAAAAVQASISFSYYGGNNGRYAISLGYSDGGYYAPRYYAPQNYPPPQANYYYDGGVYAGPCRIGEITSYYRDGRVTCSPDPAFYGANDRYYRGSRYYRGVRY